MGGREEVDVLQAAPTDLRGDGVALIRREALAIGVGCGVVSPVEDALVEAEQLIVIEALEVDLYGNIANWPKDFFGDEVGDLVQMTLAASDRHQQELQE